MVYGARPDNPVPLAEDMPLAADTDSSVAGDLLEIEQLARRSPRANPGMAVTVVRPAALVGDNVDTLVTRHFEAPRLLTVKGCAPRWQFCHVDDLVSAVRRAGYDATPRPVWTPPVWPMSRQFHRRATSARCSSRNSTA